MAEFESAAQLHDLVTPFLQGLVADPELRPKFVAGNTSFQVQYTDPDEVFMLDCTVDPPVVSHGQEASGQDAEVRLTMSADDAHRFWLGKLNVPMAIARRKVKVEGQVSKLLKLLPAITPAFDRYRIYVGDRGYSIG
ncbi:MAG: SCP2 sterol-binding domain-containing protein [Actinomycetota bacterium]|nr:SCP2 sterol-binding domain-containing protein [Actinomycetota bacterium]